MILELGSFFFVLGGCEFPQSQNKKKRDKKAVIEPVDLSEPRWGFRKSKMTKFLRQRLKNKKSWSPLFVNYTFFGKKARVAKKKLKESLRWVALFFWNHSWELDKPFNPEWNVRLPDRHFFPYCDSFNLFKVSALLIFYKVSQKFSKRLPKIFWKI